MKNLSLKKLKLIEIFTLFISLFVGYFNNVSVENGINLGGVFNYFYYLITFINIVLVAFEFNYKKAYLRLIYLLIIINIVSIFSSELIIINTFLWFFHLVYLIPFIISFLIKRENIDFNNIEKGKLNVGVFSKKHKKIINLLSFFFFLIMLFIMLITILVVKNFIFFLAFFIFFFMVFLLLMVKFNPLIKELNKVNNDLDINYFFNKLNLLKKEELHSDSLSYVLLLEINYLSLIDKEKSINEFSKIGIPNNKSYLKLYESIELCYLYNKFDYDTFMNKLNAFKKKYPKDRNIRVFDMYFKIDEKSIIIENIEKLHKYNYVNNMSKLINYKTLMHYYNVREDYIKAKYFAKLIIELKNSEQFIETYNEAKKIINKDNTD